VAVLQDPNVLATSIDGGVTFNPYSSFETDAITATYAWASLASSGDGRNLLAANNPWLNVTQGLESFIVQNGDLWTSRDGGDTWTPANLPDRGPYTEFLAVSTSADGMTLVTLAHLHDGTVVDVSNEDDFLSWDFQETSPGTIVVYFSSDSGSSWSKQPLNAILSGFGSELSEYAVRLLQISADGGRLLLALASQVIASEDAGVTWNSIFTASNVYDFATGGSNGNSIVVLDDEGIHVSSDGGLSFSLAALGVEEEEAWNSVEISRNGEYIAVAAVRANYFAVSDDAGSTWGQVPVYPSYWTIAGVSDDGRITSSDGAFNLWIEDIASSSVFELNGAPSVGRAAARGAAAVRTLSDVTVFSTNTRRFLVVDDFSTQRRIVRNLLKELGENYADEAENGEEALTRVQHERFDVIIIDWNLGTLNMNGTEFVERFRAMPSSRNVTIIMVTSEAKKELLVEAARVGANGYVVKPFTAATLSEKLERAYANTPRSPSAPTIGTATSSSIGTVVVPFTASLTAGNPPVTQYTVKCVASTAASPSCQSTGAGVVTTTVTTSKLPLQGTLSRLVGGTVYKCYAIANNGFAQDDVCSSASDQVTVVAAPTVTSSSAGLAQNAATVTVAGTGFNAATPSANAVAFNLGAMGAVTAATSTSLIVTFSTQPTSPGSLTAVVTLFGGSSGAAIQVATVVAAPIVASSRAGLALNAATVTIAGTGFNAAPPPSAYAVAFNLGAVGAVTAATSTSLNVTFSTLPTSTGSLTAVVTAFGGSSGAAVDVATVVAPPAVASGTGTVARNAATVTIAGTGFNAATPSANAVAFNLGAVGAVTAATSTSLTVAFSTLPTSPGSLTAVVTSFGGSSGAAVQVAAIVAPPTVATSTDSVARNAATVTIAGTGFNAATPSANAVAFNLGAVGAVTAATSTSLTVTFSTQPTSPGSLTAVVTSFGGSSSAAVQVATVVAAPIVTASTDSVARNAASVTIAGTGFNAATPSANAVAFNLGAVGAVTAATSTSLTVTFSTPPTSSGSLTAVVTLFGGSSGAAVQVATVVAAPTVTYRTAGLASNAALLSIAGSGFNASTPSANDVMLSTGAGTVISATSTVLTMRLSSSPRVGALTAVVTSFGGSSGVAVRVGTVVAAPTVTTSSASLPSNVATVMINGTGFYRAYPSLNSVVFSSGSGAVISATPTSLLVRISWRPYAGRLTAVVTSAGYSSGSPVEIGMVSPPYR
jgi:CheY-like chemotaxis protein